MKDARYLKLIEQAPDGAVRHVTRWACPACRDEGRASGPVIEIALEAFVSDGVVTPGQKALACIACLARGRLTTI